MREQLLPPVIQPLGDTFVEAPTRDVIARYRRGEQIWMQLYLEAHQARTVNLYQAGTLRGFINQSYDDMLCSAYAIVPEPKDNRSILLLGEQVPATEAVALLLEACEVTP